MNRVSRLQMLEYYRDRGLNLIPLKPRSKTPLVKWKQYKLSNEDFLRFVAQDANWALRCDEHFHALDFDDAEGYANFLEGKGRLLKEAPTIRTARGYHVWFKPKKPVNSFSSDGVEIKGLGTLVVVPPSVHPSGVEYYFEKPLNGRLPEIDIEELFGSNGTNQTVRKQAAKGNAPSDFALRYGKSPYPQSLCGLATKVFSRSDGRVRHLVSLRCWKWDCPKCAPLLKRHWLEKLRAIQFRFILKLPTMAKPTAFLRHVGKPGYAHIIANGEGWLFLTSGDAERVCPEAKQAGYKLIAGDIAGDSSAQEVRECLEQALCREEQSLNTRRKITHSRNLFTSTSREAITNESKRNSECEEKDMSRSSEEKQPTWKSEVVMKPIEQVAKELEEQGWHVLWQSDVEAIAIKDNQKRGSDMNIVKLMETLGIKLKKVGKEYKALCPFHDDHEPSLSVNREKNMWHCFGCGRGGDTHRFIQEWQSRNTQ